MQTFAHLNAEEHGPELREPVCVHSGGGVHVLLGGHDELVVDHVVRGKTHPEQGARRVQVSWHPVTGVHVLKR